GGGESDLGRTRSSRPFPNDGIRRGDHPAQISQEEEVGSLSGREQYLARIAEANSPRAPRRRGGFFKRLAFGTAAVVAVGAVADGAHAKMPFSHPPAHPNIPANIQKAPTSGYPSSFNPNQQIPQSRGSSHSYGSMKGQVDQVLGSGQQQQPDKG